MPTAHNAKQALQGPEVTWLALNRLGNRVKAELPPGSDSHTDPPFLALALWFPGEW